MSIVEEPHWEAEGLGLDSTLEVEKPSSRIAPPGSPEIHLPILNEIEAMRARIFVLTQQMHELEEKGEHDPKLDREIVHLVAAYANTDPGRKRRILKALQTH